MEYINFDILQKVKDILELYNRKKLSYNHDSLKNKKVHGNKI